MFHITRQQQLEAYSVHQRQHHLPVCLVPPLPQPKQFLWRLHLRQTLYLLNNLLQWRINRNNWNFSKLGVANLHQVPKLSQHLNMIQTLGMVGMAEDLHMLHLLRHCCLIGLLLGQRPKSVLEGTHLRSIRLPRH